MRRTTCVLATIGMFLGCVQSAQAHFLWLGTESTEKPAACLWFAELAAPGEAELIDKVSRARGWQRMTDGSKRPLEWKKVVEGDLSAMKADLETGGPCSLEAVCDYGVITREGKTFLLEYYAKHLRKCSPQELQKLGRTTGLTLDIVPSVSSEGLEVQVYFGDKPAATAELMLFGPDGKSQEGKTDSDGKARFACAVNGIHAVRAAYFESADGQQDGKAYRQIRHYSTLTLHVSTPKSAPDKDSAAAMQLLERAREQRAVWEDFHGFRAELTVHVDGQVTRGRVEVDDNGVATLDLPKGSGREWAEEQIAALAQHRMPTFGGDENATFADDERDHPLGPLLNLGDKKLRSAYRIKDDVVTEVNRQMGNIRFTISVLEVLRNKEQKYLPRSFTITYWDVPSGAIKSTQVMSNTWQRVGKFDLPEKVLSIETANSSRHVKQLDFSKYELVGPTAEKSSAK